MDFNSVSESVGGVPGISIAIASAAATFKLTVGTLMTLGKLPDAKSNLTRKADCMTRQEISDHCDKQHKAIVDRLSEGDRKFETLIEKITDQHLEVCQRLSGVEAILKQRTNG